jgi:hypothetical protein
MISGDEKKYNILGKRVYFFSKKITKRKRNLICFFSIWVDATIKKNNLE